ncbi:MAG: MFS transporter [Elusimicrobia bacterium]|nr:MFS transporter [Elusimicrobiota bacterium]
MPTLNRIFDIFKELPPSSSPIQDPKELDRLYKYWRWRTFYASYVGYVVYYFTRKNISSVLHLFSRDLGISVLDLGLISTTFYATYGLGKFASGIMADRSNLRYFMATGLLLSSVVNLFYASLSSVWLLAFFWGLNGFFQSMGFAPVARALVHWYSPKERATIWTLWGSSHTAGIFLVGILITGLIKFFSWKAAFYVPGVIGVLVSLWLINRLRDTPVAMGLPPIEKYRNDPFVFKKEAGVSHWEILKKYLFANPGVWVLSVAYIFVYMVRFGTLDWATKFMYDVRGIDAVKVTFMWTAIPLLGMPGGIIAGYLADRFFGGRCTPVNIIYLFLLACSVYGFYHYASPDHVFITCCFLGAIGFFVDGPQNLIGGVQASRITAPEAVSAACGFIGLFGYLGAMLSGSGLAYITNRFGWGGMFGFCIAGCFLAMFLTACTWNMEKAHITVAKHKA